MCGYLHPYLIHGSLGPPESTSRTTIISDSNHNHFSRFCRAHGCDRPRDRPCYSICSNRPHLASAAVRLKNAPVDCSCPLSVIHPGSRRKKDVVSDWLSNSFHISMKRYWDDVGNTVEENAHVFPVMQMCWLSSQHESRKAGKLCSSRILGAGWQRLNCHRTVVAVVVVVQRSVRLTFKSVSVLNYASVADTTQSMQRPTWKKLL